MIIYTAFVLWGNDWARLLFTAWGAAFALFFAMFSVALFFGKSLFSADFRHQSGELFGDPPATIPSGQHQRKDVNSLYIAPTFHRVHPTAGLRLSENEPLKAQSFEVFERLIFDPESCQYIVLLAEAGMGKSSFFPGYQNWRRRRLLRRGHFVMLNLGMPDVDYRIAQIENPEQTILFLDALNEDIRAEDHPAARLRQLMHHTRKFARVVFTDRRRAFPRFAETQTESNVYRLVDQPKTVDDRYHFNLFYLSPFDAGQVSAYLNRRFNFTQPSKRKNAHGLIRRLSRFPMAPIYLNYIPDLLESKRSFHHTFEVFDAIIDVSARRETRQLADVSPDQLSEFWEILAVDIYVNRKQRLLERISRPDFLKLAARQQLALEKWQPTEKSLLRRDSNGFYHFEHRTFMEYLFFKRFLKGDPSCRKIRWSDQMQLFLREHLRKTIVEDGDIVPYEMSGVDFSLFQKKLRAVPLQETILRDLQRESLKEMLRRHHFFDQKYHPAGRGLAHIYEPRDFGSDAVVIDHATALMWQPAGSVFPTTHASTSGYLNLINQHKFAGFEDWRLPTLEEAMSLATRRANPLFHIDNTFDFQQQTIWTSDLGPPQTAWGVDYLHGACFREKISQRHFVRAVRTAYDTV